jgi:UDP-N-acetylglucosamine diphosphorylase/glucosamine-1-phosphate N-acetyltransferase
MSDLYLVDPSPSKEWLPFCDSRPLCELRVGAWLIRERWEAIAQMSESEQATILTDQRHLLHFVEDGVPDLAELREIEGPAIVGDTRFAPTGVIPSMGADPCRLVNDSHTVGWWVPRGHSWARGMGDDWAESELDGLFLHGAYDLVTALEMFLVGDVADMTSDGGDEIPQGSIVLGQPHDVVLMGATVEPGVTFDVRRGAVVLDEQVYVKGGTRFEGPVYVGPGTQVLGGQLAWASIGPVCKVRGEISNTVFLGYANKSHDGFLGHSVVGRWVNLGADTVTSNLKNTYGTIRLDAGGAIVETGRQLLGSLLGDHAKTAIGTLLGAGTIVGVGANVFGPTRPPKYVQPFAWGADGDVVRKDGFLATVDRVLPRRNVPVTDAVRAMLGDIYDHSACS